MDCQAGENELLLTCRKLPDGVSILRCRTGDGQVRIPDRVGGSPVRELGPYALSTREPEEKEGLFQVRITCGGTLPDRHRAEEIHQVLLPPTLRRIGDYAFYNCRNLSCLALYGSVTELGGDAFMNCSALSRMEITLGEDGRSCLRAILSECSGDLQVTLRDPSGRQAVLFFPAYLEDMELLVAPHIFRRRIEGAGYAYRQCVTGGVLNFIQYDACLDRLLQGRDFTTACRIALNRLRWPWQLSPGGEEAYRTTLKGHGLEVAFFLIETGDTDGLAFLLGQASLEPGDLGTACDHARQMGRTEALALLLEAARSGVRAPGKTYDL